MSAKELLDTLWMSGSRAMISGLVVEVFCRGFGAQVRKNVCEFSRKAGISQTSEDPTFFTTFFPPYSCRSLRLGQLLYRVINSLIGRH